MPKQLSNLGRINMSNSSKSPKKILGNFIIAGSHGDNDAVDIRPCCACLDMYSQN